ncbi:MAG: peptide deformylase [Prevotellaceae bacterium]|jgi:peptide deformylase|nr:peptide deformylase [Prevotellaceae bacterium]
MILPIYLYGNPVLRKLAQPIDKDYPKLTQLIDDMYETMYRSEDGVGLAAPQVGISIRLFVIDLSTLDTDKYPEYKDWKKTFINPEITERFGEVISYDEGCLSLPGLSETVRRHNSVRIKYLDENFTEHEEEFSGFSARVIQHEYDHLEGHMYIDHISPIRRQMIKGKLNSIAKGKVNCKYKYRAA